LLIGWLVEWVIDWFYWRHRMHDAVGEKDKLKEGITSLEEALQAKSKAVKAPSRDRAGQDNFQAIYGIGPAFSKRLQEACIHTFEQLAKLTPGELEEILGKLFKRFFAKENSILAQAQAFAEQKRPPG
jgi:predicted flap endonuclease-1-like 5' DNA nuclease